MPEINRWPLTDRDTTEFPSLDNENSIKFRTHLEGFLNLDGVGWNDYDTQLLRSGLNVEHSRLRTYRKMYERLGLIYRKLDKIRLGAIGLSMRELRQKKYGNYAKSDYECLKRQAINVLARYQLMNPAETGRQLPESCDVFPYRCIWEAMVYLDNKLHIEEINRVIAHIMTMSDLDAAIERIVSARTRILSYTDASEANLKNCLGEPVLTNQHPARVSSFMSLAGWGGLVIEHNVDKNGFYKLNGPNIPLISKYLENPPELFVTQDYEEWFAYYSAWPGPFSIIGDYIDSIKNNWLDSYRVMGEIQVEEHSNIERGVAQGGYGRRQLYELVQNGADAINKLPGGLIKVILTEDGLYCANEGDPIDRGGAECILSSHTSRKRGSDIGRFGQGFKSVLGVTSSPKFYSRSGCFSFDAEESAKTIKEVVPNAKRYPALRIAFPENAREAAETDQVLFELMNWADSIVKLPRNPETEWLSEDIAKFPSQFLLFCPHVGTLVLEDRIRHQKREIRVSEKEGIVTIEEGDNNSDWKVFRDKYHPSEAACKDAIEIMDEKEYVDLAWAVPIKPRQMRGWDSPGQFWAFFPTITYAKLSGIVNAPWKTNQDRQTLLPGKFNEEIIGVIAKIVSVNLHQLLDEDDPGRFLDTLPGRTDEKLNFADNLLNERIYEEVASVPSLPDMNGVLRSPTEIKLHPANIPTDALESWRSYSGRPDNWCHHTVHPRYRISRVQRLMELKGQQPSDLKDWLEALVEDSTPEASLSAIITAARIITNEELSAVNKWAMEQSIRESRILLTEDGDFTEPIQGTVFVRSEGQGGNINVQYVHSLVCIDEGGRKALDTLGIGEADITSELQQYIDEHKPSSMSDSDWEYFWKLVGNTIPDQATKLIRQWVSVDQIKSAIRVRTVSGDFFPINETLFPGKVVPGNGSRDLRVSIDLEFHDDHKQLLVDLGAVNEPYRNYEVAETTKWFYKYLKEARIQYYKMEVLEKGPTPREDYVNFPKRKTGGPLYPMFGLSEEGRVEMSEAILDNAIDDSKWTLRHDTDSRYPKMEFPSPPLWILIQEGYLRTSLGINRITECVGPSMEAWREVMPVVDRSKNEASWLGLPETLDDLSQNHWTCALEQAKKIKDAEYLGKFYAEACKINKAPDGIQCIAGVTSTIRPPNEVTVISNKRQSEIMDDLGKPYILVPTSKDEKTLVSNWGLLSLDESMTEETKFVPSGSAEGEVVGDKFVGLSRYLTEDQKQFRLVPCNSLRKEISTPLGTKERNLDIDVDKSEKNVYFLDTISHETLLDQLLQRVWHISIPEEAREDILAHRAANDQRKQLLRIRGKETLEERLLEAVGFEKILSKLPVGLIQTASEKYGDLNTNKALAAKFVLKIYGIETLKECKDELQRRGLEPPVQWAGGYAARRFVKTLGFPEEYAGFRLAKPDSVLEVDGPSNLPPLHDFQQTLVTRIRNLLKQGNGNRGLISLPTGAGKTRVAVQSLIEAIRDDQFRGPILWVAQTYELCEQAVQSWGEVWRSIGPRSQLHINRLWASNEADLYGEGMQVVVATIDKLKICIDNPEYGWLANPSCLLIDEAHVAITPEYTKLLNWLNLGRGRKSRPLLGLTATPFRGGVESTKDLVNRFFATRLDDGVLEDDSYTQLQDMGVLAQVDHKLLDGIEVNLSPEELKYLKQFERLPWEAGKRIGSDMYRNEVLLQSIKSYPGWPILLFAVSVDHARTMAALLNAEGIPSAAISGETDPSVRRYYIEEFRQGRIQVLTNYAVLTAGFDAPATRAIYVARPTFSPGLYQQMIGRGLRGPKNGGKDRCLIVNVKDNFAQYGERLAFMDFEYLWNDEKGKD